MTIPVDSGWADPYRVLRKDIPQIMKALRTDAESAEADFHELPAPVPQAQVRQGFIPPILWARHNRSKITIPSVT